MMIKCIVNVVRLSKRGCLDRYWLGVNLIEVNLVFIVFFLILFLYF